MSCSLLGIISSAHYSEDYCDYLARQGYLAQKTLTICNNLFYSNYLQTRNQNNNASCIYLIFLFIFSLCSSDYSEPRFGDRRVLLRHFTKLHHCAPVVQIILEYFQSCGGQLQCTALSPPNLDHTLLLPVPNLAKRKQECALVRFV